MRALEIIAGVILTAIIPAVFWAGSTASRADTENINQNARMERISGAIVLERTLNEDRYRELSAEVYKMNGKLDVLLNRTK